MNGIDIRLGYTKLRGILDGKRTILYKSISDILISMFSGINKCSQGRNIFVIDFGSSQYQKFVISLICVSAEFPAYTVDHSVKPTTATTMHMGLQAMSASSKKRKSNNKKRNAQKHMRQVLQNLLDTYIAIHAPNGCVIEDLYGMLLIVLVWYIFYGEVGKKGDNTVAVYWLTI